MILVKNDNTESYFHVNKTKSEKFASENFILKTKLNFKNLAKTTNN